MILRGGYSKNAGNPAAHGIRMMGRNFSVIGQITLALIALIAMAAQARANSKLEYAVKATFAYKFVPFVSWPPGENSAPAFTFCIAGHDQISEVLPLVAKDQSIGTKPIAVKGLAQDADPQGCDALYIAAPETQDAQRILMAAEGKPILTITDGGTPDAHGIIAFRVINGHVRFDIDLDLATLGGLQISSKLLSLAHTVLLPPGKEE